MLIRKFFDPILTKRATLVEAFDKDLEEFVDQMFNTMIESKGIGLAANQVGDLRRIIVTNVEDNRLTLINPEIVSTEGKTRIQEGCLSFPDVFVEVERAEEITVSAKDTSGQQFEIQADGLLSICIQHEIDHINGITFLNYLSRQRKRALQRRFK